MSVCVCFRRNCELGSTLATMYHSQHLTKRVNVHTHEFYFNRQSKYDVLLHCMALLASATCHSIAVAVALCVKQRMLCVSKLMTALLCMVHVTWFLIASSQKALSSHVARTCMSLSVSLVNKCRYSNETGHK